MSSPQPQEVQTQVVGTQDGLGAGDHDQPYRFGWRPRSGAPYPFNTRQYVRLLLLRSRVEAGMIAHDDLGPLSADAGRPGAPERRAGLLGK